MNVAILHEGHAGKSEDNWLLKALIDLLDLDKSRVSFYGMGSKSNFFKHDHSDYRELLPLIDAEQIDQVLFVVDADFQANDETYGGYQNSLETLQSMAEELGIGGISEFYICCDPNTQEGNVESLLLSTLDEEKKACIDSFLECSDFKAKENSKAILKQIYKIAYPEAPFDFEHVHFTELKEKLALLLSERD